MSDTSDQPDQPGDRLLPPHGGYRKLRSFHVAQAIYDATVIFCDRFIDRRSRTHDQMVQAARSGVRNIEEGSVASGTSKKGELKLTNVARASLVELLRDYEDFLRHRNLPTWAKDSPPALAVRHHYQSESSNPSDKSDQPTPIDPFSIKTATAEVAANTLLCLIHQATYLLGRQIEKLERDFLEKGGITERMYTLRTQRRTHPANKPPSDKSDQSDPSAKSAKSDLPPPPACPRCGRPMCERVARKGPRAGQPFWGCTAYPDCQGTRPKPESQA
jgi:four helix bundle suffix protein